LQIYFDVASLLTYFDAAGLLREFRKVMEGIALATMGESWDWQALLLFSCCSFPSLFGAWSGPRPTRASPKAC
jgi:hypothetical protein